MLALLQLISRWLNEKNAHDNLMQNLQWQFHINFKFVPICIQFMIRMIDFYTWIKSLRFRLDPRRFIHIFSSNFPKLVFLFFETTDHTK